MPDAPQRFVQALAQRTLVLDGAMGTELAQRGVDVNHALWSAAALYDQPETVHAVHRAYFAAGADVATSNTYQANIPALLAHGWSLQQAQALIRHAVHLARKARDEIRPAGFVAGAIGPYGAYRADGSEYTGAYRLSMDAYKAFHRPRMALLVAAKADVLAFETMPNRTEVAALCELLTDEFATMPAWLSFSLADARHMADGTPLRDGMALLNACPSIVAIGANCAPADRITAALENMRPYTRKPLVAYPNSGRQYRRCDNALITSGVSSSLHEYYPSWQKLGARLLGGCCGTRPEDIRRLASVVHAAC